MSVIFVENTENTVQFAVCPKCGRKVRIDKDCECETTFVVPKKPR